MSASDMITEAELVELDTQIDATTSRGNELLDKLIDSHRALRQQVREATEPFVKANLAQSLGGGTPVMLNNGAWLTPIELGDLRAIASLHQTVSEDTDDNR